MKKCGLCDAEAWARTRYCGLHYYRERRAAKLGRTARATRDQALAERLEFYSERVTETGCQLWTGSVNAAGYGRIGKGGYQVLLAHRAAWELVRGPVPNGQMVLHRCDVPSCINVAHLFLGTAAENSADMVNKGRSQRGEKRPMAKLTREAVAEIRRDPSPQRVIAAQHGVSQQLVSSIKHRERWTWLAA